MLRIAVSRLAVTAIKAPMAMPMPMFVRQFQSTAAVFDRGTGTVKWFDPVKGFGFITASDDQADIFVHQSAIHSTGFRALTEGETVEYDVEEQRDGRRKAANVTGPDGVDIVPPAKSYNNEEW